MHVHQWLAGLASTACHWMEISATEVLTYDSSLWMSDFPTLTEVPASATEASQPLARVGSASAPAFRRATLFLFCPHARMLHMRALTVSVTTVEQSVTDFLWQFAQIVKLRAFGEDSRNHCDSFWEGFVRNRSLGSIRESLGSLGCQANHKSHEFRSLFAGTAAY